MTKLAVWGLVAMTGTVILLGWGCQDDGGGGREARVSTVEGPFTMFNAVWYAPNGGEAKFQNYLALGAPIVARHGGAAGLSVFPRAPLVGDFDADMIFFVDWPDMQSFQNFISDPEFIAISHLRDEALIKSHLVPCDLN